MKAVILAGGLGTRLAEETDLRPKPMVEIGGRPILWHIMKIFSAHGINDFIICCGYKGFMIKEYFANYFLHVSDVSFDMKSNERKILQNSAEPWSVTLVDTGETSNTGGRLRRVSSFLEGEDTFCLTYGDGVGDIDVSTLIKRHHLSNKEATVTATQPAGRYGALDLSAEDTVRKFQEKPDGDGGWINGGFFVFNSKIFQRIDNDTSSLENDVLVSLVREGQLNAFRHTGFWQPMDTLRDKMLLNKLWVENRAPWKIWEE